PDGVDIRDWKAFEPGVEAGYRATREALDGLDRPVTRLRRRHPLSAVAPSEPDAGATAEKAAETAAKGGRRARRSWGGGSVGAAGAGRRRPQRREARAAAGRVVRRQGDGPGHRAPPRRRGRWYSLSGSN